MVKRKSKILDSDVQLYLLGGLTGDKLFRIREIEQKSFSELKSASDQRVKTTLAKLQKVDNLFQTAADESYPMPDNLRNEIDQILSQKSGIQKKNTVSPFGKLRAYFTASNLWSLAGGGAVASFAMLAIIQIQPALLIRLDANQMREPIFRGTKQDKAADSSCGIVETSPWIVTDDFLLQIPVCESGRNNMVLRSGDKVNIGNKFGIVILPTKDNSLNIVYKPAIGETVSIVDKAKLKAGEKFELLGADYSFSEPKGRDRFVFMVEGGSEHTVEVVIK